MNNSSHTTNWPKWPPLQQAKLSRDYSFVEKARAWLNGFKLRKNAGIIGENVNCFGEMVLENRGRLQIGEDTIFRSDFQTTRLAIGKIANLTIGNTCFFNSVIIATQQSISIGDGCKFGPFVHLMDSDFHDLNDRTLAGKAGAITIGNGVQLGAKVIVLRGVTIGDNAVVLPGAVVTKDVPAGSQVAGVPAK